MNRLWKEATSLVVASCLLGSIIALDYSCDPAGVITVDNPDNNTYIGAYARLADESQNCTTNVVQNTATITIENCPISQDIGFWLLTSLTLPEILSSALNFNTIRCQQIPSAGVLRKVDDKSWVTNLISTSQEPSVTPKIVLSTQFEDIDTGLEKTSAIIGEPLLWEIDGPENYIVLPLNCTVESGVGGDAFDIVLNGCSLDTYLLTHFEYISETEKHILVADLYAFRFAASDQIVIICDLLGCHNHSTACDFTCPEGRKRKRDIFDEHLHDHEQTYAQQPEYREQRSRDLYRRKGQGNGHISGQVRGRLTVYYPEGKYINMEKGSCGKSSRSYFLTLCSITIATAQTETLQRLVLYFSSLCLAFRLQYGELLI